MAPPILKMETKMGGLQCGIKKNQVRRLEQEKNTTKQELTMQWEK